MSGNSLKKPDWLRISLPKGPEYERLRSLIKKHRLNTVCVEAKCPNIFECFSRNTATFLILGPNCTRNCRFCSIGTGKTGPPDPEEPVRVAMAASQMNLRYVVVTSVTRDDLPDGGAGIFAETIIEIKKRITSARVEVLIPDFKGDREGLKTVIFAGPDVLNHNIETVSRLYPRVRPVAEYQRSLTLLKRVKKYAPDIFIKSGIMLGLGEEDHEIMETLNDLYDYGCRILTIGQYLQPTRAHLPVHRYLSPDEFDKWRTTAINTGFYQVSSGPFVRSSYNAREMFQCHCKKKDTFS
ncbi:MAG: lipoyl synthase [Deltaproteobacteria bacterium]|nr:lipoyl synthase [Deltaproteobacteria bacterium]